MLIHELLAQGPCFSFEFFPPKNDEEQLRLTEAIRELEPLRPAFVSVTYRGGRSSRERTTAVVLDLLHTTSITPMPHLTCVCHTRLELEEIVSTFVQAGLPNLLALGGDPVDDGPVGELTHAVELVQLARWVGSRSIGVAAQPAGHPRSPTLTQDRDRLAAKLAAADFAITQLFFDRDEYLRLVDDMASRGVHKPIVPGIMPVTTLRSITRMAELSGYSVPDHVVDRLAPLEADPSAVRTAGIEMASELCRDLLEAGAPGLHFFTLNRSTATREIYRALGLAPV
ncbi:MAG: methylenetetrahydrofolate reductase [Candidatus Dormibacteraeota bacterium]|nr:methylenetetrahydrofolate reductase [Candidatus Dormibacteraeota bacterium]